MKTVYGDMVGDMFHKGHVNLLRRMSEMGEKVIIGIISDENCETYKRTPICTLEERMAVIQACKYVDEVIPNAPLIVTEEFMNNPSNECSNGSLKVVMTDQHGWYVTVTALFTIFGASINN